MELRHIYALSEILNKELDKGETLDSKEILEDMEINIKVNSVTHYGIDREFYYLTHNNSYEGFVHNDELVTATINGVKFNILCKN